MQGNDKLGPLPQTLQEGHHQAAHVVGVVGGEGVLVLFDGRQSKSPSTETTRIFKIKDMWWKSHVATLNLLGEGKWSIAVTPPTNLLLETAVISGKESSSSTCSCSSTK